MKRYLLAFLLLLTATASGAYWLRISASYNQNNTTSTDFARQRLFLQFNDQTVVNYALINASKVGSFDSTFVVDSLGWYSGRIVTINNNGDSLQEDFYRTSFYGTASVNVATIANNAITSASIAADAIGESEIATGAITSLEIAADAIGASEIASNAIGAAEIADDAIDAGAIAANAIGSSEIATDAIGSAEIASGAIVAGTEATGFSTFNPAATGVFLTSIGTDLDTGIVNLKTKLAAVKAITDKLLFDANDSLIIDYGNLPTVTLTQADLDYIIQGIIDAGVILDTAAFRANIAATPLIVGTNNDKLNYYLANNAIAGAVIQDNSLSLSKFADDYRHEIALRADSGNAPTPVIDNDAIAAAAYAYFTEGSREDVFKGGAGTGPDTTTIVVLSASDSLPIVGAAVSYYVGAEKLATRTDSLGQAIFGATAGSYTAIVESKPRYASTQTVTAGTRDTIFMTSVTVVEALDTNLCRVQGYLYNLNGDPVAGAIVSADNQKRDIQIGNTIISHYAVADTTDATGYWFLDLYPSATLGDTTYKYTFRLFRPGQSIINKQNIIVPDSASWQFTW